MKKTLRHSWAFVLALVIVQAISCKKDPEPEVLSGFSFKASDTDFKTIRFTNASSNFTALSWDFGDGSAVSTEENPVHTYAAAGSYTVKLTATGSDGSKDVSTQTVGVTDPNAELAKLAGDVSKTWKLLRVVAPGRWPLEVGPISKAEVWWAMGRDNDEIALRPCVMNDEYTFSRDGKYTYNSNGDFWAEGNVFVPANLCQTTTPANLTGPNGLDLSAFGDGVHGFTLNTGAKPTLKLTGLGAFIGLPKIGTDVEVSVPQQSVTLDVVKLTDGAVDTLILESDWKFKDNTTGSDDAYWKIVLVHYDDPSQEPALPSPKPVVGFTSEVTGLTIKFTNTTQFATTYNWNFGDGNTSTEKDPIHTYAAAGVYKVVLTANNTSGTNKSEQEFTVTSGSMTEANLIGGPWKIRLEANSIFVGPALGSNAWWVCPLNYLDGSSTGVDDWSCITNDEFIFSAGGVYEYKTNGDARNDGYMGTPPGCISDATLAASGNGAAFGSAVHSFTFTPASGSSRPILTVTNGTSGAAFVGFYKGYYGGENATGTNLPNGGATSNRYEVMSYLNDGVKETLTLSVDASDLKDGTKAWTMVLVR